WEFRGTRFLPLRRRLIIARRSAALGTVEELGEPDIEAARRAGIVIVEHELAERGMRLRGERRDLLARRPSSDGGDRLADPDADALPETQEPRAVDGHRREGHLAVGREKGCPVVEGQDLVLSF